MTEPSHIPSAVSLQGRTALVTGGSGGIGSAAVKILMNAGAEVWSLDRPGVEAPAGAKRLECDLACADSIRAVISEHCPAPDVVVHSAGVTRDSVLWKMKPEDWDLVMRINLDSAFHILQAIVPGMRKRESGSIVMISSINGERGKFGQANYAASKAGLLGLMKTSARELGRFGIRVNAITPGLIDTEMTRKMPPEMFEAAIQQTALGRAGLPSDVARTALYLCTDLSSHVTGQTLRVDGGTCMI